MRESGTSSLFDDAEADIARLQARIEAVKQEMATADPEQQWRLRWWIYGANRKIWRLQDVVAARRAGTHRFVIHEADDVGLWALCSCGARFLGAMHEDFSLEEFPELPGHVRGSA